MTTKKKSLVKTLRTLIPLAVLLIAGIAFACFAGVGDLSAFGWRDISILCPVGALMTMLATKTFIPRALISLVVVVVLVLVFGRAFCGWVCPVPLVSNIRKILEPKPGTKAAEEKAAKLKAKAEAKAAKEGVNAAPLTERELKMLKGGCGGSCAEKHGKLDARHFVLGGSLLSAAIFGFPVFCLICPVGLSFATIFLLIRLFGFGDVTWAIILVPALLILEVTVFRKWCHTFCPISAFMSLVGLGNKTFQPQVDDSKCLETAKGATCGRCATVCEVGINPRHLLEGNGMNECTRCNKCVEACPADALKIRALPQKKEAKGDAVTAAVE